MLPQRLALIPATMFPRNGHASVYVLDPRGDFHDPRGAGAGESTKLPVQIGSGVNLAPVVQGLSPAWASATGKGFALTVGGANFAQGAVVQWNSSALATQFVNSTQLIATVPVSLNQTAGISSVLVRNPDGSASPPVSYTTLPGSPLQITSLTPNIVDRGSPDLTLTMDGSGFTSRDTLTIHGVPKPFVVVNENRITTVIPSGFFGDAYNIEVVHCEVGNHSNTALLWVTMQPILTSVSPQSVTWRADLTLAVRAPRFYRPTSHLADTTRHQLRRSRRRNSGYPSANRVTQALSGLVVNMATDIHHSAELTVLPALSLTSSPRSRRRSPALTTLNGAGFQSAPLFPEGASQCDCAGYHLRECHPLTALFRIAAGISRHIRHHGVESRRVVIQPGRLYRYTITSLARHRQRRQCRLHSDGYGFGFA